MSEFPPINKIFVCVISPIVILSSVKKRWRCLFKIQKTNKFNELEYKNKIGIKCVISCTARLFVNFVIRLTKIKRETIIMT